MIQSMSARRLFKQFVYAAGFFGVVTYMVVVVLFAAGVFSRFTAPAPSPPPQFQALVIEALSFIPTSQGVDVVAQIRNPNANAGIPSLPVEFLIKDSSGQEVGRHQQTSYILPGTVRYITALNVPIVGQASDVEIILPDKPTHIISPPTLTTPVFSVFLGSRQVVEQGNQLLEEQQGVVFNASSLDWRMVDVTGVARNGEGEIIGVGQTVLGDLLTGQQRDFRVQWPVATEPTQQVTVLATTNMYREENIIQILGDPQTLR